MPRTFEITLKAERTSFGRIDDVYLVKEITDCMEYLMLENVRVEVKEIAK